MKCFTLQDVAVMEGVAVEGYLRPTLAAGAGRSFTVQPEYLENIRLAACRNEERSDVRFEPLNRQVMYLMRASLEIDQNFNRLMVPETEDESQQRALIFWDIDLPNLEIPTPEYADLSTYSSLAVDTHKVTKCLTADKLRVPRNLSDTMVTRLQLSVILKPGDRLDIDLEWWRIASGGRLMPSSPRGPRNRTILWITYDGSTLTLHDHRFFCTPKREVLERF